MKIEQIYTGCLAQGAYYITSKNEAAIIDPLRESGPYLLRAEKDEVKIKYVFETHFHADFVSGHVELARKSGATIVYGPKANPLFDFHEGKDGEIFVLGDIKIQVLHTPGHTMESTTYLLYDEAGREHAIFSGDTLFIGDVGRPDLAQKGDMTQNDLAGMLYDSLRNKIMTLPDEVIVFPAHGAGSACGKNMSKETSDRLGNQKKTNYALRADMSKKEFIHEVTAGLLPPPKYFSANVSLNKSQTKSLDTVLVKGETAYDVETFESTATIEGALILDTRSVQAFTNAHIPNSIFVGLDGSFAPWVGALVPDLSQPILLVAEEGREKEAVTRLSRVGYDNTLGYLKGGLSAWCTVGNATDHIDSISAEGFKEKIEKEAINILDVRKPGEYDYKHIEEANSLPLDYINERLHGIDKEKKYYVHCAGGYRSLIAGSIMKARGIHNFVDVAGGMKAIEEVGIPLVRGKCPNEGK